MSCFVSFWVSLCLILGCFGSVLVVLGQFGYHFGSPWLVWGCFGSFSVSLGRFALFWLVLFCFVLGQFRSLCELFWVVFLCFSLFWVSLGLLVGCFDLFWLVFCCFDSLCTLVQALKICVLTEHFRYYRHLPLIMKNFQITLYCISKVFYKFILMYV